MRTSGPFPRTMTGPGRRIARHGFGVWWIRASIQEYILRNWSLVRIGTTQTQRRSFNWLTSSQRRLTWLRGLDDADAPGRPGNADGPSLRDQLADGGEGPEDRVMRRHVSADARRALQAAMQGLDPRRRAILEARYLQDERATLGELAEVWGVTKERIRQLEVSTVKNLRKALGPLHQAS